MGAKKDAKKKAKAEQAWREKYSATCPKCQHPAHEHRFVARGSFMTMMMGEAGVGGCCQAKIEKPGDDGFLRVEPCKCDLKAVEAQLNAEKASGLKSFDKLMSSLTPNS